ncbi:MAG: SRPBCC domain-containing protein [Acidobacteriaceae bacterium]
MTNDGVTSDGVANKYDLVLERVLDAPRAAVWSAWTDPAQLAGWWGPKRFTNPVCRADARPGGAIFVEMRAPDGTVYPMSGTYLEVVEPERIVFTSAALDELGKPKFEVHTTVTFADLDGKTALKLVARVLKMTPADATQHLDGMREGWSQSLDRLAEMVTNRDVEHNLQSK